MFHKIARFVKTVSFAILSWRSDRLQKRLMKKMGYDSKKHIKGVSVDIKGENYCDSKKLDGEVKLILKNCKNNPVELVKFLSEHKTPVFELKNAEKVLGRIHEKEGFITERTGMKALFLNYILTKKIGFKTPKMFVVEKGELDIYNLIHGLHKWCAYKNGLAGLDERSQSLLRRFDYQKDDEIIKKLGLKDIERVREAIARDVQSIDFVVQYAKENAGAKKALEKLKNKKSVNI